MTSHLVAGDAEGVARTRGSLLPRCDTSFDHGQPSNVCRRVIIRNTTNATVLDNTTL